MPVDLLEQSSSFRSCLGPLLETAHARAVVAESSSGAAESRKLQPRVDTLFNERKAGKVEASRDLEERER